VTRRPSEVFALALFDGLVGAGLVAEALTHGDHRHVLVLFFVYLGVLGLFQARGPARRLPQLVQAARAPCTVLNRGPWWLRTIRLLIGYDSWLHVERFAFVVIAVVVCTLFGWDDGGPFAAALFLASAGLNAALALVAVAARLTDR
jgi:uncharacterized membrane protein